MKPKTKNTISIHFDNATRIYTPGSAVTGIVTFYNKNAKRSKFISLKAFGEAKVGFYNQIRENWSHDDQMVFEYSTSLWKPTSGHKEKLPRGKQAYVFSFMLPKTCPPAFKGNFGSIEYGIEIEVHQSWAFNLKAKFGFVVASIMDKSMTSALMPVKKSFAKNHAFGGEVNAEISLPKRIFSIDEKIPVRLVVENLRGSSIKTIEVGIQSVVTYKVVAPVEIYSQKKIETLKTFTEKIDEINHPEGEQKVYEFALKIDKEYPTISNLSLVHISNAVYVKISKDAVFSMSAEQKIPIMIITIPNNCTTF